MDLKPLHQDHSLRRMQLMGPGSAQYIIILAFEHQLVLIVCVLLSPGATVTQGFSSSNFAALCVILTVIKSGPSLPKSLAVLSIAALSKAMALQYLNSSIDMHDVIAPQIPGAAAEVPPGA